MILKTWLSFTVNQKYLKHKHVEEKVTRQSLFIWNNYLACSKNMAFPCNHRVKTSSFIKQWSMAPLKMVEDKKKTQCFCVILGCFKSGVLNCSALTFAREQSFPFHCAIRREGRVCRDPGEEKTSSPLLKETSRRCKTGTLLLCVTQRTGSRTLKVSKDSCFMRGTCAPDDGEEKRSQLRLQGNPATHPACLTWRTLRLFIRLQK